MKAFIDWLLSLFQRVPAKNEPVLTIEPTVKLAWGNKVTPAFRAEVFDIGDELRIAPDHIMAVIAFESNRTFSPSVKNLAGSGATGLIQFMPATATGLGTSVEDLAQMSAVEQLEWVRQYFRPYKHRMKTLSDVYMAVLWPRAIGKPDDYVLWDKETRPKTYRQNAGLDVNKNGAITKFEAASKVYQMLEEGRAPANRWVG